MNLGQRIQELRKENNLTQAALAEKIRISLPQIVRYETKDVQPPADVLKRMADVFGTSIDYIVNGNINEKAQNSIKDSKLLQHFKAIENMDEDDKNVVLKLIDAFITKRKVQQLAS
jgi:transcriptional regulator with XRE-family HTH domain